MCCLLFVVCLFFLVGVIVGSCTLFADCCRCCMLPDVGCLMLVAVWCWLFVDVSFFRCSLFVAVVCCMLIDVGCCLLDDDTGGALYVICWLLYVVCCV